MIATENQVLCIPLSMISADPGRFQVRGRAFSEQTVKGIIAEGINLQKYEPVPVIREGDGYVVGGDGHSRLEAFRRMAELEALPAEWESMLENEYEIPCKLVSLADAMILSYSANLSRDPFKPMEEADVYQRMLNAGMSIDEVAKHTHRETLHVKQMLTLNVLCYDIRLMVGASQDAGGISKDTAIVLARKFTRYNIGPSQQRDLWHRVLKEADLTPRFINALLDRIGAKMGEKSDEQMLFALPVGIESVMKVMKSKMEGTRKATRGLSTLLSALEMGALDELPELKSLLESSGAKMLDSMKESSMADAELAGLCCLAA